ncbi:ParB family protein [Serratia aquatilis]|uniref:ParB family protein n=1 Tax=Serratia aquatilis TaxID=1737515 RepID=A0ABV6EBV0_9GAMM
MGNAKETVSRIFTQPAQERSGGNKVITLSSGRKVSFCKEHIAAEEVAAKTSVAEDHNGRDQAALTEQSLKDIIRTLSFQQFYPVIGMRRGDIIEILDGSRRRASAIFCEVGLDVLVTEDELTPAEARQLAKDIQTSREHSLREIGMRLAAMKSAGLTQKEIAKSERLSQARVTRALQAASVSGDLMALFPVQNELSFTDFKILLETQKQLNRQERSVAELVKNIEPVVQQLKGRADLAEDEVKKNILLEIKREAIILGKKPPKDKPVITPLWAFSDKNRFARKKVSGRVFSYEFSRLPTHIQGELDRVISEVLQNQIED